MNRSAQQKTGHVTTRRLLDMKQNGEKISMLTAYDYTMARILDRAGPVSYTHLTLPTILRV